MHGSAIPRVMSKYPRPEPPPEISHYECAGVNCTQKKAWRSFIGFQLDGDLKSSAFRFYDKRGSAGGLSGRANPNKQRAIPLTNGRQSSPVRSTNT